MKEIIEKISSYNLFNYLFPGALFIYFFNQVSIYKIAADTMVEYFFVFYLAGLVVSRLGSLILEPLLEKKVNFIKKKNYKHYIEISKSDPKLDILSEVNNMYRTLTSLFFWLMVITMLQLVFNQVRYHCLFIMLLHFSLFIVFLFSYRKQTTYIHNRIESQLTNE